MTKNKSKAMITKNEIFKREITKNCSKNPNYVVPEFLTFFKWRLLINYFFSLMIQCS